METVAMALIYILLSWAAVAVVALTFTGLRVTLRRQTPPPMPENVGDVVELPPAIGDAIQKTREATAVMVEALAGFEAAAGVQGRCLTLNFGDRAVEVHSADCPTSVVARIALPQGIIAMNKTKEFQLQELTPEQLRELGIVEVVDPKTLN